MQSHKGYESINAEDDLASFVTLHATLIHKLAKHIKARLPLSIELDDLIQSGLVGLLEARTSYSSDAGASFVTYASLKIRCAMYEFIRKNSGITRDISQNIKKISAAVSRLENEADIRVSDQTIANEMGIDMKKYNAMIREINAYQSVKVSDSGFLESIACDNTSNPLLSLEEEDEKASILSVLEALPQRDQIVLALHYTNTMNFKDIGEILDLTEARISQIHSSLLMKLKQRITHINEVQS